MAPEENKVWLDRLNIYARAFEVLERWISAPDPSEGIEGGIIHFYEVCFEAAWKLMKEYLEAKGYRIRSPRDAIKQAFQSEIIADGREWIDALEARNLTVHTYDEEVAQRVLRAIREVYYPMMRRFLVTMKQEADVKR